MSKDTIKNTMSIVIPTYNRKPDLLRLIDSIINSSYSLDKIEIIIVDNAGSLVRDDFKNVSNKTKVKLLNPGKNLFCSGGRHYGALKSSGQFIFFIDDDNVLEKKCLFNLANAFNKITNLGVASPLMLFYKNNKIIWTAGVRLNKLRLPVYLYKHEDLEKVSLPEEITELDSFPNAFMVKREVFYTVPFDVINFPHNWSEADFGLRVRKQGYKTATITNALDWHDIDYDGLMTRTDKVKIYDQAKSRILFRKRFFNSMGNWIIFWCINFPSSSLIYLKAILMSSNQEKFGTILSYIKGTFDGITTHISQTVSKR